MEKSAGVHGAQTVQQCLDAGLLDEIHVDLAAVSLGAGVRLFDHLANTPAVLGNPKSGPVLSPPPNQNALGASSKNSPSVKVSSIQIRAFAGSWR